MKKKYKLIQTYPGSLELNTVITVSDDHLNVYKNHPKFWQEVIEYPVGTKVSDSLTPNILTKQNDGWYQEPSKTSYKDEDITNHKRFTIIKDKPVVEKDYEILTLISKTASKSIINYETAGIGYQSNEFRRIYGNKDSFIKSFLNSDLWNIHSIKRLSDGEIFTVNDKVVGTKSIDENRKYGPGYTFIKEFRLADDRLVIEISTGIIYDYRDSLGKGIWNFLTIKKYKSSLFKTEDGVDVFEGDKFYCLNANLLEQIQVIFATKSTIKSCFYRYFSTKEKAEEYVRLNKILFKTYDGVNIKEGDIYYYIELDDDEFSYLIVERTASNRDVRLITKQSDIVAFSTHKAAKQYIFLNKPCLSLADVASVYVTANQPVDCTTRKDAQNRRIQDLVKQKLNL
jgi:hypothetical protein